MVLRQWGFVAWDFALRTEPNEYSHMHVAGGTNRGIFRRASDMLCRTGIVCVVWVYRCTLGPFLGGQCRHFPTCSQYMLEAVDKYGPWKGGWMGVKRVCRCQPWGTKGFDPP